MPAWAVHACLVVLLVLATSCYGAAELPAGLISDSESEGHVWRTVFAWPQLIPAFSEESNVYWLRTKQASVRLCREGPDRPAAGCQCQWLRAL